MIRINSRIQIPLKEVEFSAIRAQGAGGQNVNKVASAIQLQLNITASSIPVRYQERIRSCADRRISKDGIITIKAQRFRTAERNKQDAIERLRALILKAIQIQPKRVPTKPTRGSQKRRLNDKNRRSQIKENRRKPDY